ncbi:bifunctional non-homologous end joining protein LigD [Cytobacillus eiseniae]|uniref:Bifunctional non-homologous end joining protein LigD n=1 Tax=Cytobacillus eiseniae TaxID=762947 RepID=A0ABS4R9V0_9BACI|nr:DNA ligase D [Cytobacillus eiseniae]MBP2239464.1 bifunctional non-homologous end joining protein LigD [Cytobacillus eiseniae]
MKPMLPSLTFELPKGSDWVYEVKYDGFRAILYWDSAGIRLESKNGKSLMEQFPEIKSFLETNKAKFAPFLPFILDGELVFLENAYKANFHSIQVRGRMRSEKKIAEKANTSPCKLLIFDVIMLNGKKIQEENFLLRKEKLTALFKKCILPLLPDEKSTELVQLLPYYQNFNEIWENVILFDGEGIVTKQVTNKWEEGKRTSLWLKYKNWKYVNCFITAYEKSNGYYYAGVFQDDQIIPIGQFLFGLKPEEKIALFQIIKENMLEEDNQFIYIEPAICVEVKYLEMYEEQMREPHFHQFRFDLKPEACTLNHFIQGQKNLPPGVEITHPEKPLWATPSLQKIDYIHYLREISPYMLPYLNNRLLTVIRYPHGVLGESFYQKDCPEYAPDFVQTHMDDGIQYIVCNDLKTLLWLGNQLAFEYHIPFQKYSQQHPSEIVFDLDPPSRKAFGLAIKAAQYIKEIFDQLELIGFVKTSGNKGLQVYLPLPDNTYSYEDTRLFTTFVANYLLSKEPRLFTIERMKKNRGDRLYIDYIQHAEGKTIIAPYSPRGTMEATIATPLHWDEVNDHLNIVDFQIPSMIQRLNKVGDPFQHFFQTKEIQKFTPVLDFLKK